MVLVQQPPADADALVDVVVIASLRSAEVLALLMMLYLQ
jgi:hypothetical protein